jgi:hypothetical protein
MGFFIYKNMETYKEQQVKFKERRAKIKNYLIDIDNLKVSPFSNSMSDTGYISIEFVGDQYRLDNEIYTIVKIQNNGHLGVNFYFSQKEI